MPPDLAQRLTGRVIEVEVLPEELARTRRIEPNPLPHLDGSYWIDPDGNFWNDYCPPQISFTDSEGRRWRVPRRWVDERPVGGEQRPPSSDYSVTQGIVFSELVHLPTPQDLWEINMPWSEACKLPGTPRPVEVRLSPDEPIKVIVRDSHGGVWRIPHDWRRRRVKLPNQGTLISQGIPADVAGRFGQRVVSVNYHPGSRCCLPDQYRFRDEKGNPWPVYMRDCILLGYGDSPESTA